MAANPRITTLVQWASSHGAVLNNHVEVHNDPVTGFSFRVKDGHVLPAWETVVSLPTSLSLSYLNAVSQGCFHPELVSKTPPHVVGRLFLVKEYLRGKDSFWWPYIQALPQPDDKASWALAPFWPKDEAELLEGTNVEVGLEKIRRDVKREYEDITNLLRLYHAEKEGDFVRAATAQLYQWAYCIFSSRSFRPSLVLSPAAIETLPEGVKMDDFSVLLPLFDIGNHDMTVEARWELREGDKNACELKVGKEYPAGQQVFNNYSMKTNAELLLGYGFMIPATEELHNDYTHVRKRTAPAAPAAGVTVDPGEYYISRRPMDDPSSLLGRNRQVLMVELPEGRPMLGAFRHVQPDMVWDIFCTLAESQGTSASELITTEKVVGREEERERQQKLFSGAVDEECGPFLEQTVAIIQHKMLQELERLEETEVEIVDGDEDELSGNQKLALEYRRRCRAVLENALEAMETDIE
ncbi:unnamed protein product [Clonostachys rosea]|uniref:SET domain-containing protein n=1 Tax=Bionectria ochroleuca TaxID=29856 RepID=A0ABY6U1B5_BIOOC|nr:unnamed protein product [Clonostachys rosea]